MTLTINEGDLIGQIIVGLVGITGNLFLALVAILIILLFIALALRIPIEAVSIIYLPLVITMMAYTNDFMAIFGAFLIYLGVVLGKNLLPK